MDICIVGPATQTYARISTEDTAFYQQMLYFFLTVPETRPGLSGRY